MSTYDTSIAILAKEIVQHLGGDTTNDEDFEFVAEWLVNGGDDGSNVTELVSQFDMGETLPSKGGRE